jgi:hypothetical protein
MSAPDRLHDTIVSERFRVLVEDEPVTARRNHVQQDQRLQSNTLFKLSSVNWSSSKEDGGRLPVERWNLILSHLIASGPISARPMTVSPWEIFSALQPLHRLDLTLPTPKSPLTTN